MKKEKKCIFHMLTKLKKTPTSGSELRPLKMMEAFEHIGYQVEVISGNSAERKACMQSLRQSILQGEHYDFVYSESSTMPTLLTDADHIPRHPLVDFSFLKFCRNHGIKVGLFYRDAHWKFPLYYQDIKKWIPWITIPFYKYDLRKYAQTVDMLYVPSSKFKEYIDLKLPWKALPPGCVRLSFYPNEVFDNCHPLKLFYVGGIQLHYEIVSLVKAVNGMESIQLTLCCHEDAWNQYKYLYSDYLCDRVKIIHKNSMELAPYYREADIGCLCFKNSEYMDLAMPIKLFEYIGQGIPVIATKGTAAAEFVEKNDIGWTVENDVGSLEKILSYLENNRENIMEKKQNVLEIIADNTWEARAKTVVNDLTLD